MKNVVVTAELTVSDDDADWLVEQWRDGTMCYVVYDGLTPAEGTYFFDVSHLRVEDAE